MFKHKNKDLNQPATVGDFQELAHGMAEVAVTKDEFNDFAKKALKHFATKEDIKDLATKQELTQFKSEILASNDKLSKKLDKILTEQTAKLGRDDRQDEDITALKTRVSAVEQHTGIEPMPASA